MEDRDKLIDVLERIKTTIFEVQTKFSEAADLFSRKRAYDITKVLQMTKNVDIKRF